VNENNIYNEINNSIDKIEIDDNSDNETLNRNVIDLIAVMDKFINYNNEDLNKCKICFERKCNTICIPCGHFMFCNPCIEQVMLDIFPRCPVCRKHISKQQRVYQ